jgi:hypothetical protein
MLSIVARILGVVVALLAIAGFFVEGEHLFDLMNVDIALDALRVVIAVALLYVGFARVRASAVKTVIVIVGVVYVLMGALAFADRTLFGLLPTGLTAFDIGFHLVVGIAALILAVVSTTRASATTPAVGRSSR